MNVGRNTDELLRIITALQVSAKENILTPINWKVGADVLLKSPQESDANNTASVNNNYYSPAWFLLYKKTNPE